MQEFCGQTAGQALHGFRRVFAAGDTGEGVAGFALADVFGVGAHLADQGLAGSGVQPLAEFIGAQGDDFFGGVHCLHSGVAGAGGHFAEVVQGVKKNIGQFGDFGLHIAGGGQVGDENGFSLAGGDGSFHGALADDRDGAGGGADDDVKVCEFCGGFGDGHGFAADSPGEGAGADEGASGDGDAFGAAVGEDADSGGGDVAGAEEEDGGLAEVGKDLGGEFCGEGGIGEGALSDGGFAADFLGHCEGAVHQAVDDGAGGAGFAREFCGGFNLPGDFVFAEDLRVQSGGDAKEMGDGVAMAELIELRKFGAFTRVDADGLERGGGVGGSGVEPLGDGFGVLGEAVDFGAVAGGDDGGFAARDFCRRSRRRSPTALAGTLSISRRETGAMR